MSGDSPPSASRLYPPPNGQYVIGQLHWPPSSDGPRFYLDVRLRCPSDAVLLLVVGSAGHELIAGEREGNRYRFKLKSGRVERPRRKFAVRIKLPGGAGGWVEEELANVIHHKTLSRTTRARRQATEAVRSEAQGDERALADQYNGLMTAVAEMAAERVLKEEDLHAFATVELWMEQLPLFRFVRYPLNVYVDFLTRADITAAMRVSAIVDLFLWYSLNEPLDEHVRTPLDEYNSDGRSILHVFVHHGRFEVVCVILEHQREIGRTVASALAAWTGYGSQSVLHLGICRPAHIFGKLIEAIRADCKDDGSVREAVALMMGRSKTWVDFHTKNEVKQGNTALHTLVNNCIAEAARAQETYVHDAVRNFRLFCDLLVERDAAAYRALLDTRNDESYKLADLLDQLSDTSRSPSWRKAADAMRTHMLARAA